MTSNRVAWQATKSCILPDWTPEKWSLRKCKCRGWSYPQFPWGTCTHQCDKQFATINKCKYMKHIFWTADERSNRRKILAVTTQLKQLRKESLKKIQAWTGFEPMTSAMLVQCSNLWIHNISVNCGWKIKIIEERSLQLLRNLIFFSGFLFANCCVVTARIFLLFEFTTMFESGHDSCLFVCSHSLLSADIHHWADVDQEEVSLWSTVTASDRLLASVGCYHSVLSL